MYRLELHGGYIPGMQRERPCHVRQHTRIGHGHVYTGIPEERFEPSIPHALAGGMDQGGMDQGRYGPGGPDKAT